MIDTLAIVIILAFLAYELHEIGEKTPSINVPNSDFSGIEKKLENIYLALGGSEINKKNRIAKFNLFKQAFIKELEEGGLEKSEALAKANDLLGDTTEKEEMNLKLINLISEFGRNKEKFYNAKTIENSINWWIPFINKKLEKGFIGKEGCYKCGENKFQKRIELDNYFNIFPGVYCKKCGAQQGWWYKREYLSEHHNKVKINTKKNEK